MGLPPPELDRPDVVTSEMPPNTRQGRVAGWNPVPVPPSRRQGRVRRAPGWAGAGFGVVAAGFVVIAYLMAPDVPADHSVTTRATVVDVFIDGMGGPLAVDYRYSVGGHTYTGWGEGGELGNGDAGERRSGDTVTIRYSTVDPSISCTCDPNDRDRAVTSISAGICVLPAVLLVARALRRRRNSAR